jgi:hypothetical protein
MLADGINISNKAPFSSSLSREDAIEHYLYFIISNSYISDLSKLLEKEVILTPENEHETVLLKASNDNIIYNTQIYPTKWAIRPRK